MADDPMQPTDSRGDADRPDLPQPMDLSADPLGALGYEAADPALLARLWGEPVP